MALLLNVLTFEVALLTGRPQFEESQTPAGYSQVSATGQDVASMKTAFTVQQNPPTGSATPSLSSCSTVRTGGRMKGVIS